MGIVHGLFAGNGVKMILIVWIQESKHLIQNPIAKSS